MTTRARVSAAEPTGCHLSGGLQQTELRERGHAVVETDLFDDSAILETQHRRAGETHLAAGRRRQRADQEVAEGRTGMRTATFPATDDIVAFGDQVRGAPEVQVREGRTEVCHERFNIVTATAWFMQRILQKHVGRGEFVDDVELAGLTPKVGEPTADNGFIIFLF